MRRLAATVAFLGCALAACGGGGGGSGGSGGADEASGKDDPGSGGDAATAVVDPSVCPPVDELEQHAGETLGLTYAAEVEAEGTLDCTYESDDSDLRVMIGCSNYESVEAAVEDLQLRLDIIEGTTPYDGIAGEQGVIQDMELSDPGLETLGYRAIVRQGPRICQALWSTDDVRDPDQQAGLGELLDYIMVTIVV